MNFMEQFVAARNAATPLIAIRTQDQWPTVFTIANDETQKTFPIIIWDIVSGLKPVNEYGKAVVAQLQELSSKEALLNPVEILIRALELPHHTILFMRNLHRLLSQPEVMQALWNLRDALKENSRSVVILCPFISLPPELEQDVIVFDEPLPNAKQLAALVGTIYESANVKQPTTEILNRAVDALCGLSHFSAEQVCAMSITEDGLDLDNLWERKRQQVEMTPGLSMWRGAQKFSDIGGLDNIKQYIVSLLQGRRRISVVIFIDELEKMLAGASGDTSGVTQEMLGQFLTWMQDRNVVGIILIGPPGTGKSLIAKAAGNEGGIPTVTCDISGMKGSLVGESGSNLRRALRIIDGVAGENTKFVIATCVDENTIVQSGNGALKKISSFCVNDKVISFDHAGLPHSEKIGLFGRKSNELLKLESSAPDLFCTPDHLVFKWTGSGAAEVLASEIRTGDFLATPRTLPHGKRTDIDDDFSYLLGYTCGDGNSSGNRIQWSENDQSIISELRRIITKLFDERLGIHARKNQNSNLLYSVSNGKLFRLISRYQEVCASGSHLRSIPTDISSSCSHIVRSFLTGLFDADGSASRSGQIAIGIVSRTLRDQTYMLLRRFGISATCGTYIPKLPRRPVFRLTICGSNAAKFAHVIGFRSAAKQLNANAISSRSLISRKPGRVVDLMPVDWNALDTAGYKNSQNRTRTMARERLLAIKAQMFADGKETNFIDRWLAFDWSRVKKISSLHGEYNVFDIKAPLNHTFCGSGLVLHNCNSIASLPPELRRRFKSGTWFMDLPDEKERDTIWKHYLKQYKLTDKERPADEGWTGAEVEQCCDLAWSLNISLKQASQYIVPVAQSAKESVQRLREFADGKFISASHAGKYTSSLAHKEDLVSPVGRREISASRR